MGIFNLNSAISADREDFLEVLGGTSDDVHADELSDAARGSSTGGATTSADDPSDPRDDGHGGSEHIDLD